VSSRVTRHAKTLSSLGKRIMGFSFRTTTL
jgi:hypothetical protein